MMHKNSEKDRKLEDEMEPCQGSTLAASTLEDRPKELEEDDSDNESQIICTKTKGSQQLQKRGKKTSKLESEIISEAVNVTQVRKQEGLVLEDTDSKAKKEDDTIDVINAIEEKLTKSKDQTSIQG